MPALPISILETCLYVDDLPANREFYGRLFEFSEIAGDERFCVFHVREGQLLLLFLKGASSARAETADSDIPAHGSQGAGHLGFAIPVEQLAAWQERLALQHVPVERQVIWPKGGTSLYFRDPSGNLLEVLTPGVWPSY
jgi:catechol 2,3-dioxygenase-like lactoylglutathione lyase family enzyme